MQIRLSCRFLFPNRDALSFVRPARFAGEKDFKDAVIQPWFLPRAGENASKGPVFENVSGFPRACENVLEGSLSDSGRAGESMLKRLVSECCSRSSRAGEFVLKGAMSESSPFVKSGAAAATVGSESSVQAGVLHSTSSLFLNPRIHPHGHRSRIHGSSHRGCCCCFACWSASSVVATPARFSRSLAAVVVEGSYPTPNIHEQKTTSNYI